MIAGANEAKADTLLEALKDRPGVNLEIEGHVDMEKDREGLIEPKSLAPEKKDKVKDSRLGFRLK